MTSDEVSAQAKPITVVFLMVEKDVSIFSVWIYPHRIVKRGARVIFFRANEIDKIVCYIYLPEYFEITEDRDTRSAIEWVCNTAEEALQDQYGITFSYHNYDTHVESGDLNVDDLAQE